MNFDPALKVQRQYANMYVIIISHFFPSIARVQFVFVA